MKDQSVVLSNVLHRECVGLEPLEDGLWQLWFGPVFLGTLRSGYCVNNRIALLQPRRAMSLLRGPMTRTELKPTRRLQFHERQLPVFR
jgi:hypothetical protein